MENSRLFDEIKDAPFFEAMGRTVEIPGHIRITTEQMAVFLYKKRRNFNPVVITAWNRVLAGRIDPEKSKAIDRGEHIDSGYDCFGDFRPLWEQALDLWNVRLENLSKRQDLVLFSRMHKIDMERLLGTNPIAAVLENYIFPGHPVYNFFRRLHEIMVRGHWVCGFAGYRKKTAECTGYPVGPFYYY